jgi:formylglycine-generating enzyme required for sulfatase activity
MGYNPNVHKNNKYPVANVSWDECQEFIKKINHITSLHFDLPTEAQWEFAAKGGNKSKNTIFSGSDKIEKVAWYKENSRSMYHIVGTLAPNELGIHDMSGNVWEWCSDYYAPYPSTPLLNPKGPSTGINKVYRGGSWLDNINYTRITNRNCGRADYKMNCLGLRLILIP